MYHGYTTYIKHDTVDNKRTLAALRKQGALFMAPVRPLRSCKNTVCKYYNKRVHVFHNHHEHGGHAMHNCQYDHLMKSCKCTCSKIVSVGTKCPSGKYAYKTNGIQTCIASNCPSGKYAFKTISGLVTCMADKKLNAHQFMNKWPTTGITIS